MRKVILGFAAMVALFTMSCNSKKSEALSVKDLDGEWTVTMVNGQEVKAEEAPFLGFDIDDSKLYGYTGCNRLMGALVADTLHVGKIKFDQVASTRRMCHDMNSEQQILEAMANVAGFEKSQSGISLVDAEGIELISMTKREVAETVSSFSDLAGKWIIKEVAGTELSTLDEVPFIEFDVTEMKMHGNAGCNIINGELEQAEGNNSSLQFVQVISTMKSCPSMDAERGVLLALDAVRSFAIDKENLVLFNEKNEKMISLSRN